MTRGDLMTALRQSQDQVESDTAMAVPEAVPVLAKIPARSRRHVGARSVALGVLFVGLLTTVLVALFMSGLVDRENEVRLARANDGLEQDLRARITIYSETLVGLQGLYAASDDVSRLNFVRFTESANVFERFPGLQGLSFSPVVARTDLENYEQQVREDASIASGGYPDFAVRTNGEFEDLFVVDYIVPFEGNEAAFGFDLGSNPARRSAIEQARDTGLTVATAPITLVQENEEQVGVLLLAPAYDGPTGSVTERRQNFVGVFSAVLRVGDFLDGASSQDDLRFAVFDQSPDQEDGASRTELYATGNAELSKHATSITLDVAGRQWGIAIDPSSVPRSGGKRVLIIFAGILAALPYALASYFSYRERDQLVRQAGELQMANNEIRNANVDLERFAYVAAHDLQTPVRNVRNVVEMLEDELPTERTRMADDLFARLIWSATKMEAMIQGLLDFSSIRGRTKSDFTSVDIEAIAREAVALQSTNIDFELTTEVGDLPRVSGNAVLLERLFENLVGNAIKYRDPARTLEIRIFAEQQGKTVLVSVADNGLGIDPEFHDRIFEIFRRLHGNREVEGLGLGLALCSKIVEHHGGTIWVDSTIGIGSTFNFTIDTADPT